VTCSGPSPAASRTPARRDPNTTMTTHSLGLAAIISTVLFIAQCGKCQTSELYVLYSPNVIYPVGTTSVYQGGHRLRSWTHVTQYEIPLAVVGGTVRQAAVFSGFSGSEYTSAGVPTGTHYTAADHVFDAASDGTWIFGWNVETATLMRYDLNWNYNASLFSLGTSYSYAYMGITYDLQNNSIWLAPWNGSSNSKGYLYDYALDGTLLRTLPLASSSEMGSGLAYDSADNTLWMFNWGGNRLEQYSKDGNLLSTISGITRIYGLEFAVVPEPSALALGGTATVLFLVLRARNQRRGRSPITDPDRKRDQDRFRR
jgi:hypothetical protein